MRLGGGANESGSVRSLSGRETWFSARSRSLALLSPRPTRPFYSLGEDELEYARRMRVHFVLGSYRLASDVVSRYRL